MFYYIYVCGIVISRARLRHKVASNDRPITTIFVMVLGIFPDIHAFSSVKVHVLDDTGA